MLYGKLWGLREAINRCTGFSGAATAPVLNSISLSTTSLNIGAGPKPFAGAIGFREQMFGAEQQVQIEPDLQAARRTGGRLAEVACRATTRIESRRSKNWTPDEHEDENPHCARTHVERRALVRLHSQSRIASGEA
jgi:hypothetical protein